MITLPKTGKFANKYSRKNTYMKKFQDVFNTGDSELNEKKYYNKNEQNMQTLCVNNK